MTKLYLISPPKIDFQEFPEKLEIALKTGMVAVFQLRLKGYEDQEIIDISKKLIEICVAHNTLFILNDRLDLALKVGASGVHLGGEDGSVALARQSSPKEFVIGVSCYDSRHLAVEAAEQGADYVSFGTFFPSKTKNSIGKPTTEILQWCDEILTVMTVAIGGIDNQNCQELVKANADFIAVISYVWDNEKGIDFAIRSIAKEIE